MAFVVARRTKEIGIRMALAAKPSSVIWIIMKEVLLLLGIGLFVGVLASLTFGRFVSGQLYGVQAKDPWVAALTGIIPGRRASRIDSLISLKLSGEIAAVGLTVDFNRFILRR